MNTNHKIRIGLNEFKDIHYLLTENNYYRVLDEYQDLIDKDKYVIVVNDFGREVSVKKANFIRFESVSLTDFKKILSKQR